METAVVEIVCCLVMGANAYYYLAPLGEHAGVSRLWVVRPTAVGRGVIPKSEYKFVVNRPAAWRLFQIAWITIRLGRRKEVKAFTSINPFPYGLIQLPAALLNRKPIHFGFVGSDWYKHAMGKFGCLLRPFVRRADFVTATGPKMREQMVEYGIDPDRIAILPHAIDLENYQINDPKKATYTCIFVGQLIERKRVDIVIESFANVRERYVDVRLCIVGDGILSETLKAKAAELEIDDSVDFVGFQKDVRPYIQASKILVMASEMEGLPFTLIESMCSGLVPVITPVGTITDLVVDEVNGLLVSPGDPDGMAKAIIRLLDEPELYTRLRAQVLTQRHSYSFEAATEVWDKWLSKI